jgi:NDP-sugar pyrophosphorylase family protein
MINKAMILAAGLGTRLGQQTRNTPKALIEVGGKPMIAWTIERLKKQGIEHFLVNVHHHAEQVIAFLKDHDFQATIDISDESNQLLDTGGALKKAVRFFEGKDPILVHNADIISDINLAQLYKYHEQHQAMATLCVRHRKSDRALLFDLDYRLVGWVNRKKNYFRWVSEPLSAIHAFAFSGIYLVNPRFVSELPFAGKFSIIDAWLTMAGKQPIFGYEDTSRFWFDLGTAEKIRLFEQWIKNKGPASQK